MKICQHKFLLTKIQNRSFHVVETTRIAARMYKNENLMQSVQTYCVFIVL